MRYFVVEIEGSLNKLSSVRDKLHFQKDDNNKKWLLDQTEIEEIEINAYKDKELVYSYNEKLDLFEEI